MVAFGALAFILTHTFSSISTGLMAFTDFTLVSFESRRTNAFSQIETRSSIETGCCTVCFVTVDAVEARGADAEARGDAEPSIHAARSTKCFLTVWPIESIWTFTYVSLIAKSSISASSWTLRLLTGFKEDGVLRGLEDDIAFCVHYDHIHFECSHSILFSKARKPNLNH